jgi:hypothetical protein
MQLILYSYMKTSRQETRDNLARTPAKLLDALKHLANLRDDEAAFQRFASRWPGFTLVLDEDPGDDYVGFNYLEPPTRRPPNLPKRFLNVWQARQALREIWRGNSEKLTYVLFGSLGDVIADPDPDWPWPPQLKVDWQRGEFVYIPRSEFDEAVYTLFRRSALSKVCANPDCPAPYFIAGRTTQQYCSEKCSGVLQRTHKLRWWKEHGKEWRSGKRSRGKRGKR